MSGGGDDREVVQHVRWTDWNGQGLEHCVLSLRRDGLTLEGMVAGTREGRYGAHYTLRADSHGRTRDVRVRYAGGPALHVMADGTGHWRDAIRGERLRDLDGCIDIDLGVTPATNALPVRRLGLAVDAARAIRAAYVPLPAETEGAFLPRPVDQCYTRLADGLWRYEGLFRDFTADLPVDDLGLVLDYPMLFRRLPANDGAPFAQRPAAANTPVDEAEE